MRDILQSLEQWREEGKSLCLATVVKVYGSAPRPLGAKMVVSSDGEMAGSVSGGCLEGTVVEEARKVLKTGVPRLLNFGITDEQAWAVGLSCGGEIEVFVEPLSEKPWLAELVRCLKEERTVALATAIAGPRLGEKLLIWPDGAALGDLGSPEGNRAVQQAAARLLAEQKSRRLPIPGEEGAEVFLEVFPPPPRLILIGAVHVAVFLLKFARILGFHTLLIDPRSAFANRERFAEADELVIAWPQEVLTPAHFNESTFLVVLSHDEKLDNPALRLALESPCCYIGALGSRKTHARRLAALKEAGVLEEQLARIHAPIGLDLGGHRPEEIALSILAEIVAVQNQGSILRSSKSRS